MANAEQFQFGDFTRENYSRLVRLAKQTYVFRRFTDYSPSERFVLWRHDVDFSPQAAVKMAEREAAENVVATYFVLLHSDFYNLLERDVTNCVRRLVQLGHDVGLHFDPEYDQVSDEPALVAGLTRERRLLEEVVSRPVTTFSFHNPNERTAVWNAPEYAGMVNAAASYFYTGVSFCSDSNGYWRRRRLEDVLTAASDERLQVLTHPEMWQDEPMSPLQRVHRCIDGRALKTKRSYADLLKNNHRLNIDDQ